MRGGQNPLDWEQRQEEVGWGELRKVEGVGVDAYFYVDGESAALLCPLCGGTGRRWHHHHLLPLAHIWAREEESMAHAGAFRQGAIRFRVGSCYPSSVRSITIEVPRNDQAKSWFRDARILTLCSGVRPSVLPSLVHKRHLEASISPLGGQERNSAGDR